MLKRIILNWRFILKATSFGVGGVYTILGFLSVWLSLGDLFPSEWSDWIKLLGAVLILIAIGILCFVFSVICMLNTNENKILTSKSNHKVVVHYGDMYSTEVIAKNYSDRRNIIVSVNRCFDTIVDNDLVSERTQHGRIMKQLYSSGLYNEKSLNETIQGSLHSMRYNFEDLTVQRKSKGNTYRYEVGSVAEVNGNDNIMYFFLGLSKFDSNFRASTTKEEFTMAIQRLIEFCYTRSQGYPVVLPLIGSDLARTDISQTDILRYIVQAFKINSDKITCDFHIVVWKGDKDKISISNL